jgi:signal transduction histidine kinase/CHASE1-domain containing sensor protein
LKKNFMPILLALLLLTFTLFGAIFSYYKIVRQEELIRSSAHRQVIREISSRLETYQNLLLQTRSMFHVTQEVDRKEFHEYVKKIDLPKFYPGVQGVGFAQRVLPKDIKLHEKFIQKEVPLYRIWPQGERSLFFPIIYLEPQDWRNKRAMGYDMYSEDIRHEAMSRAIKENQAIMSGPVELVQETKEDLQVGFLIYVPVFHAESNNEPERLLGFVYSPFRSKDLFDQIMLNLADLNVDVEVIFEEKLIFDRYPDKDKSLDSENSLTSDINFSGKVWKVRTYPLPDLYPQSNSFIPFLILFFGTLLTLIVTVFLLKTKSQARELEERSFSLQQIQDASRVLISKLELKDVLQTLTDIGLELSKAQFGAFFYNTVNDQGESYMLYTLSGVKRSEFEKFPMPRNTEIFAPTFNGETVISADITLDPRFGKNEPYHGMPAGHLPVRSYLAVAVKSKNGEVIGALFYGHKNANVFSEREKNLIQGLSQQAAIAIENATLFQKAQKAIASREEFLNIASHELKTPITSMKLQFQSALRMIEKKNPVVYTAESVNKRVEISLRQLDKMLKLIEEMLDSSRISLGKFELQTSSFDFRKLAKDLLERYEENFRGQDISVNIDLGPEEEIFFEGDEYRLEQVISNLLNNAVKYGEESPIEVKLSWNSQEIHFSVKDYGSGISKENLPKIFERYERLVSATNVSGLGLGLYISKNIVESHGGEILVDSEPKKGTIFEVVLPRGNESGNS